MLTRNSAPVRFATMALGAMGGAALVHVMLGTTVVLTTSWLVAVLAYIIWAALYLGAAYAGAKLADKALTWTGTLSGITGLFGKKAA
jgi:hypothetical protein